MDRRLAAANAAAQRGTGRIAVWLTENGELWHRWVNYATPAADPAVACGQTIGAIAGAKLDTTLLRGAERHEACR